MTNYVFKGGRPDYMEKPAMRQARDRMNFLAAWCLFLGTWAGYIFPILMAGYAIERHINRIDPQDRTHILAALLLFSYGILVLLHRVFFIPKKFASKSHIASRASGLATFWAGYLAAYALLFAMTLPAGINTPFGWHIAPRDLILWSLLAFVPLLASLTQVLVPEGFWHVADDWSDKMLVNSSFATFMHVSLTVIVASLLLILTL